MSKLSRLDARIHNFKKTANQYERMLQEPIVIPADLVPTIQSEIVRLRKAQAGLETERDALPLPTENLQEVHVHTKGLRFESRSSVIVVPLNAVFDLLTAVAEEGSASWGRVGLTSASVPLIWNALEQLHQHNMQRGVEDVYERETLDAAQRALDLASRLYRAARDEHAVVARLQDEEAVLVRNAVIRKGDPRFVPARSADELRHKVETARANKKLVESAHFNETARAVAGYQHGEGWGALPPHNNVELPVTLLRYAATALAESENSDDQTVARQIFDTINDQ